MFAKGSGHWRLDADLQASHSLGVVGGSAHVLGGLHSPVPGGEATAPLGTEPSSKGQGLLGT